MTTDTSDIEIVGGVTSASLVQFREIAERLGFTEAQIELCGDNLDDLKTLIETHRYSHD